MADRRQWIEPKFIISTAITLTLSVGGAALGSYMGTQTRTAVLESAVSSMTREMEGVRTQLTGVATLINNTNVKAASDSAKFQSDIDALRAEHNKLREYYDLQASRLDALRDRLSRIEGEKAAEQNKRRKGD